MSDPTQGPPDTDVLKVQTAIDRAERQLAQLRAVQESGRRRLFLIIAILVIQVVIFGWALFSTVRSNFSQENMVAAFEPKLQEMAPTLQNQLRNMIQDVQPVYVDLARERFDRIRPELQARFELEMQKLPDDLYGDIRQFMDESMNRVVARLEPEIRETFPAIADQESLARLATRFEERVQVEFAEEVTNWLEKRFNSEIIKIQRALQKMPVPNTQDRHLADLQRDFLHHLVLVLDHEILQAGEPGSKADEVVRVLP